MGMTEAQFWGMTIGQFNRAVENHQRRIRADLERQAGFVALIVNRMPFGKKGSAIRVEQLIGFSEEEKRELEYRAKKKRRQRRETEGT